MGATYKPCIDSQYATAANEQANAIVQEAMAWAAVYSALNLWRRYASSSAAQTKIEQADRKMVLAENALAHAQKVWADERQFVADTMATPNYVASYVEVPAVSNLVDATQDTVTNALDEMAIRSGLTVQDTDDARTARALAAGRTDLVSHAMRSEEARAIQLNDRRFSRQYAVLGLGRGVLKSAFSFGQLSAGREIVSDTIANAINVGFSTWGYIDNRWSRSEGWSNVSNTPPTIVNKGQKMYEVDYGRSGGKVDIVVNQEVGAAAQSMLGGM